MFEALFYALQTAIAIALPLVIKSSLEKKQKAQKGTFASGIAVYLLWGALLNSILQVIVTNSVDITSPLIMNPWVSAIFSGCVLAVCTLAGRFIWIKWVMKKAENKTDALVFGTGYAFALGVITYALSGVVSTVFALMKAAESTKIIPEMFENTAYLVAEGSVYTVFLITLQAAFLIVLEICISAVLFTSIKNLNHKGFAVLSFLASAVAHTFISAPLSMEIRLIILFAVTLLMSGLCWHCTKKE